MRFATRCIAIMAALILAPALYADADNPKVELFLGYSFWRAVPPTTGNRMAYLHGGSASVAYNLNRYFGLVADVAGFSNNKLTLFGPTGQQTVDANGDAHTYMIGPRLSYRRHERFTPFAQALFGGVHASSVTIAGCNGLASCTPLRSANSFGTMWGAGVDLKISRHIALRLVQGDFLLTHFSNAFSTSGPRLHWQTNVRFSTGIVFRFGGNPPPAVALANRDPQASCSADKPSVINGSGDVVVVRAGASDPDGDPLTYSWRGSGGTVEGTGEQVRWLSADLPPGTYTVAVTVSDGRGGTTSCSVNAMVAIRPNRPPTADLTSDRDHVFIGERVQFTAHGSDPDNDALTYSWSVNRGRFAAGSPSWTLETTGVAPGPQTVTVHVEDGHGGVGDASRSVNVEAPPPPPQSSKLGSCSFHPVGSARVDNVCKRVLDDVGLRLKNEPRATVVVIGFADSRQRRADKLVGERAKNASQYLTGAGVDGSRVTTRPGPPESGESERDSRIDVIWVPEGATY